MLICMPEATTFSTRIRAPITAMPSRMRSSIPSLRKKSLATWVSERRLTPWRLPGPVDASIAWPMCRSIRSSQSKRAQGLCRELFPRLQARSEKSTWEKASKCGVDLNSLRQFEGNKCQTKYLAAVSWPRRAFQPLQWPAQRQQLRSL